MQVSVTALVTSAVCLSLDLSLPEAIVYGFVFALSSTALVLRTLGERENSMLHMAALSWAP